MPDEEPTLQEQALKYLLPALKYLLPLLAAALFGVDEVSDRRDAAFEREVTDEQDYKLEAVDDFTDELRAHDKELRRRIEFLEQLLMHGPEPEEP